MRRVCAILAVISLLVFVAVGVLWVRSYWRFVDFGVKWSHRDADAYTSWLARLGSSKGRMIFTYRGIIWPWTDGSTAMVSVKWDDDNGGFWRSEAKLPDFERRKGSRDRGWGFDRYGFAVWRLDEPPGTAAVPARWPSIVPAPLEPGMTGIVVIAPHGFIAGALVLLPGVWLIRRRHRWPKGCCRNCGYDLRGTPERCPECGRVPGVERGVKASGAGGG